MCTGNASRSPAVERLLAARLGPTVTVESAGTGAAVGHPIAPEMTVLLEEAGIDTGGFAARQVTAGMLRDADLVLALARDHLAPLGELNPEAAGRTFTLMEFAHLAAAVDPPSIPEKTPSQRLRRAVERATTVRRHPAPGADDIPDPFGHGQGAYNEVFTQIQRATDTIAAAINPSRGR